MNFTEFHANRLNIVFVGLLSLRFPGFLLLVRFAIVGANWNNGAKCGRYVNLNNSASNSNVNIGSRNSLSLTKT